MGTTPSPHDAFFKQVLSHPDNARDFMEIHLPPALLQRCDLNSLQITPASFVDEELRSLHSDVLFSVKTDNGTGYIYCLIEHQSTPDKFITFRLIRYALSAMNNHLKRGFNKLPLVIPILFYHGKETPYPYPMNWLVNFDDPELAAKLYTGNFPLVDITCISDKEIMTHKGVALLEFLQKNIRLRDLMQLVDQLATLIQSDYNTEEQLKAAINYMLVVGITDNPELFIQVLGQCAVQNEELLMTIAEYLEQKGEQKWRHKEKVDIALKLLASGMASLMVMKITGLSEETMKQISVSQQNSLSKLA